MKIKKRLGEILIESNIITEEMLNNTLLVQKETGKKLGEVLIAKGYTTADEINNALKNQLGIDIIDLETLLIRQEIIEMISENMARKHEVIPVDVVSGQLLLAMADPLNYFAIEEIRLATGYFVKPLISSSISILENIDKYYGRSKAKEAANDFSKAYGLGNINNQEDVVVDDESEAPVVKFINTIIENAVLNAVSDIHIEPDEKELRVRFRVDGILREIMRADIGMLDNVVSRIKIMANLNIAEKRVPQDGRIDFRSNHRRVDIRVATSPTIYGEKIVMRVLDKESFSYDIENLGMDESESEKITKILQYSHGIILVSGPTGSGKTTTLYTMLNMINEVSKNIITIEDPVEFNFKGINQMQVNNTIGLTFARSLRSVLRQDPDVIMLGEIRDNETAEIAVRSALTGHLVFSTIHTNDAIGAVARLKDMGVEPFLIASTLNAVVAQRLVRKICTSCSYEYLSDERERRLLGTTDAVMLKRGKGCSLCGGTGYRGRAGVFEILEIDKNIRNLIDQNASQYLLEDAANNAGMVTLQESAAKKVIDGITTIEEMLRVTFGY